MTTQEPSANEAAVSPRPAQQSRGRPRHVPQRTCIACRDTGPKRGFVRLVRTPTGQIEVDPSGRKPGRGAYLCAQTTCWQSALKKGRIGQALKTTLSPEDRDALAAFAETLERAST